MAVINPYLMFNGNTEEAFNFYKSVFGGEFAMVMRNKDVPLENKMPGVEDDKIMHIALPIGPGNVLMGNDVPEKTDKLITGTNFFISIHTQSQDEADKLFNGLSAGGQVTMPLQNTFWGSYFGMLKDKFGVQWMVSYDANRQHN